VEHCLPTSAPRPCLPPKTPGPGRRGAPPFGFCGGAALLRTDALRRLDGVPGSLFCYYEDTDTSWRLRLAGYQVVCRAGRPGPPPRGRLSPALRLRLQVLAEVLAHLPMTLIARRATVPRVAVWSTWAGQSSAHSAGSAGLFDPPKPR
jgi:hypothetical protein